MSHYVLKIDNEFFKRISAQNNLQTVKAIEYAKVFKTTSAMQNLINKYITEQCQGQEPGIAFKFVKVDFTIKQTISYKYDEKLFKPIKDYYFQERLKREFNNTDGLYYRRTLHTKFSPSED